LLLFSLTILLIGCGAKQELTDFKDSMNAFYEEITNVSDSINAIDPQSPDAVSSLLENLSIMEEQFRILSETEIPEEFSNVDILADDAAQYMTEALRLYEEAYSNSSYNEYVAQAAGENYSRAMKRLSYIASLLKGEIPTGDDISFTEGDGSEFDAIDMTEEDSGTED